MAGAKYRGLSTGVEMTGFVVGKARAKVEADSRGE
jgi:hypothetical protein